MLRRLRLYDDAGDVVGEEVMEVSGEVQSLCSSGLLDRPTSARIGVPGIAASDYGGYRAGEPDHQRGQACRKVGGGGMRSSHSKSVTVSSNPTPMAVRAARCE
jgi:hypothetical protein